jgi:aldose 1-epimerase
MAAASDLVDLAAGPLAVSLAPGIGGSIAALRLDGVDLLRPLSETHRRTGNVLGVASFPMIPFANRIGGNAFTFEGRTVRFAANNPPEIFHVHGTAWHRPWTVVSSDGSSATLALAEQQFRLADGDLSLATTVTNTGAERMPFGFGHHPWFPREDGVTIAFGATHFHLNEPEFMIGKRIALPPELSFGAPRPPPDFWLCSDYGGWDGSATVRFARRGLGLTLRGDAVYRHLMVYADPALDVFCLEPQTNASCAFNRPGGFDDPLDNVIVLAPGESMSGTLSFSPFRL